MDPPPIPVPDVWHRLGLDVATFVPRAGAALFILGCFWAAGMATDAFLRRFARTRTLDPDLTSLLARAARVSLAALGVVTAIGTVGVDVKALVAGVGPTGLA